MRRPKGLSNNKSSGTEGVLVRDPHPVCQVVAVVIAVAASSLRRE